MYNPSPFVAGKHFISAQIGERPDVIRYFLAHEKEREQIAAEGYRLVTEEVTMERSVRRLVELVANHVDGV